MDSIELPLIDNEKSEQRDMIESKTMFENEGKNWLNWELLASIRVSEMWARNNKFEFELNEET